MTDNKRVKQAETALKKSPFGDWYTRGSDRFRGMMTDIEVTKKDGERETTLTTTGILVAYGGIVKGDTVIEEASGLGYSVVRIGKKGSLHSLEVIKKAVPKVE